MEKMTFPFPLNIFGSDAKSLSQPIWRGSHECSPIEYKVLQVFLNNVWIGEEKAFDNILLITFTTLHFY